jgi:hypothetical protein
MLAGVWTLDNRSTMHSAGPTSALEAAMSAALFVPASAILCPERGFRVRPALVILPSTA